MFELKVFLAIHQQEDAILVTVERGRLERGNPIVAQNVGLFMITNDLL